MGFAMAGLFLLCLNHLPWKKIRLFLDQGLIAVCKVCFQDLRACCSRLVQSGKDAVFGKEKTKLRYLSSPQTMHKSECEFRRWSVAITRSNQCTEASVIAVPRRNIR